MKRFVLAIAIGTALAAASGCCCIERLSCYGLFEGGCFGPPYGHEGPYGGTRYSCGQCAHCGEVGKRSYGGAGEEANPELYEPELEAAAEEVESEEVEPMPADAAFE